MRSEQSSRKITERKNRKTLLPSQSENEASPQQAAGYQTEGHCRGDTTVSPPSSLCKVTSQQAPRNLLIESTQRGVGRQPLSPDELPCHSIPLLRGHRVLFA